MDPEKVFADAEQAFEQWRQVHTIDNRTPREMFYFGFYYGRMPK